MTSYSNPLQAALYTLLTSESPAIAGGRFYDRPPQNVTFPYVEFGPGQTIPDDVSTTSGGSDLGVEEYIDLHVWSAQAGQKETKDIMDAIKSALHGESLTVTGRASALCWIDGMRIVREADGVRTQGIVTVKVMHRNTP